MEHLFWVLIGFLLGNMICGVGKYLWKKRRRHTFQSREEVCMWFDTLVHNYTHMKELPHETARRFQRWGAEDPELKRQFSEYIRFWSEYLEHLSNMVKDVGR